MQAPENIALIFGIVNGFADNKAAVVVLADLGVVTGGDEIATEGVGSFEERAPFDMGVAENAGVGCAAGHVLIYEIFHDKATEFLADIENIMGKAVLHGGLSGIVEAVNVAAAGFLFAAAAAGIIPGFHGDADYFIALVVEHECGDGAIDTAAHGYQYFSLSAHD